MVRSSRTKGAPAYIFSLSKSKRAELKVWGSALGGYARSRLVRRLLREYERGAVSQAELERTLIEASATVIGSQLSSSLLYVVDGMLDWHDIFRPFVEAWRNVTPTGLLRYFDNNYFYRIPLFTAEPESSRLILAPRVRTFSRLAEPSLLKVVMPGPFTFAFMSENATEKSREELAASIAKLLAAEAKAAVEAGAGAVQIDEPLLSDPDVTKDQAILATELASEIAKSSGSAKTILSIYFDVPKPEIYEQAMAAKVRCVSIDAIDAPARFNELVASKGLRECSALGLVNARNVYDDELQRLEEMAAGAANGIDELGITTSTWLDLIPYDYALRKTRILGLLTERIAKRVGGELVWRESA